MATYHPLDIAGKVAGKSSNTQWGFRQLWKKCGVHFVILPNYQEDETLHRETLENLGRSPSAEKHMRMVLALECFEGPNTQGKAERFMAATGHHLEEMMANYHSLGNAGTVAGKSSNTQWACRGSLASSVRETTWEALEAEVREATSTAILALIKCNIVAVVLSFLGFSIGVA